MRKRLKKKLNRNRCPKCGSTDGIGSWRRLKTGRYVRVFVSCAYCDMGMPREPEEDQ